MIKLASWNVRGLNSPLKQKEVRHLISSNKIAICGILETRVREPNFEVTKSLTFGGWDVIHNYVCCPNGRIWVAWNPSLVRFEVLQSTAQAIHGKVVILDSNYFFVCSFVYGSNGPLERKELWRDLMGKAQDFEEITWVIMGDFNAMRFGHEKIGSSYRWRIMFRT